jgi:hypothetical protein
MKQPIVRLFLAGLAVLVAAYVVTTMPLPFIRSWWDAGVGDDADPLHKRHRIADTLVASHQLIGRTRAEIEAQLGFVSRARGFEGWDMIYLLGDERGFFSIDGEWLVIRLDASGRASEARIITD